MDLLTGALRFERHGQAGVRDVWALGHAALAHTVLGDFDRADKLAREAAAVARTGGRTVDRGFVAFVEGFLRLERGYVGGAIAALRGGEEITTEGDVLLIGTWNRAFLGRALTLAGSTEDARSKLEALLVEAVESGGVLVEGWVRTHLAELHLAGRDPASASAEAGRAVALADCWRHPFTQARALRLLGPAAAAVDDHDAAEAHYAAALAIAADIGARTEQAHTHAARGRARARAGRHGAARMELGRAADLYREIGSRAWADQTLKELICAGVKEPAPPPRGSGVAGGYDASWLDRSRVLAAGLADLAPDVVALQVPLPGRRGAPARRAGVRSVVPRPQAGATTAQAPSRRPSSAARRPACRRVVTESFASTAET